MYNRVRIYPYKIGSKGSSVLSEQLRTSGVRTLKVFGDGKYRPRDRDLIINWGSPRYPRWGNQVPRNNILNHWENVRVAGNKLSTLRTLGDVGVSIPPFTTNIEEAWSWYSNKETVMGRSLLNSSSGKGIYISDPVSYPAGEGGMDIAKMSEIQYGIDGGRRPLPLYVKYIKKSAEYRIHVFKGEVIDIQQKRKKRAVPNDRVNYKIRSHDNGWVFTRNDINLPSTNICEQAIAAVSALGLDFGAVDVIWNDYYKTVYILEVNTAPGLEGTTVEKYSEKIRSIYERH